ncbi:MAG TPA: serine/threonine protein kinase [Ilumatobacteraceae bacterium]|nr:serine/threonine protein kinase [Ilumatobacteraceae bacterium]
MHEPGSVLGGRYALNERIALGGMGEVWSATDTVLHRVVAVKLLRTDNAAALVSRFRDEARHMAAVSHPGIAHIHDYGEDGTSAFLVMELVPGEPLSKVLADRGPLPVTEALSYLVQTADALSAAHAVGVVHRDIKPGNLMVMVDGTVKVTDFGIARAVGSSAMTAVGKVSGTPQYMSPEQATGGTATPLSDIYSLGAVGYEMLVGRPPFGGDNPLAVTMAHVHQPAPDLPESIPAEVRSLIMGALAKDPAQRPASAAAFAEEAGDIERRLTPALAAAAAFAPTVSTEAATPTAISSEVENPATAVMPSNLVKQSTGPAALGGDFVRHTRKRGRVIAYLTAAAVALLVVLVVWSVSNHDDNLAASASDPATTVTTAATVAPTTATPTAQAPTSQAPTTTAGPTVLVDSNALIGLNKKDATQRLVALGFVVKQKESKGHGNLPKDTVVGVEPNGPVPPGSTITIEVSGKK